MEIKEEAPEPSQGRAVAQAIVPLQVLWFFAHLGAIYVIVHFCTPWLAGWVRGKVLPFLQHPTSSGGLQFLFSHLFAFSFLPALLTGAVNGKFRHRAAEWVWVIPAAILTYKLLTFPSVTSVLAQEKSWPAFHHYFGGGFLIPSTNNWKDFWMVVGSSDDAARGLDQLNFTAPSMLASHTAWRLGLPSGQT